MNNKDWLILSILTFLTVAAWTVYEVYHSAITNTISLPQQQLLQPLNAEINSDLFETLKQRST